MKILIAQNLSHRIVPYLTGYYQEIVQVREVGLKDANDYEIFMYARSNNFDAIIAQDDDFLKLLRTFNMPPKVIQMRTGNSKTRLLAELLIHQMVAIESFLENEDADYFEIFSI